MKIYSPFHDYYDSVLKYGQEDDGIVYMRESEEIKFTINQAEIKVVGNIRHFTNRNIKFIGFCGKIYPIFEYYFDNANGYETFYIGIDDEKLIDKIKEYSKKYRYDVDAPSSHDLSSILGTLEKDSYHRRYEFKNPFKLEEFFIKYDTPVFLFGLGDNDKDYRWKLTKNICLKDYGFQRIIPPFECFQEINMMFNTTLTNLKTPPMPVGSDKVIAESKGFDKYSFRKMKE